MVRHATACQSGVVLMLVTGWVPMAESAAKQFEKPSGIPPPTLAGASVARRAARSSANCPQQLRDALVEMRASVSPVFLGPAVEGRGVGNAQPSHG